MWRSRESLGALFGNEKDDSFKSSLETIYQTFVGKALYPSIEEKAANLSEARALPGVDLRVGLLAAAGAAVGFGVIFCSS